MSGFKYRDLKVGMSLARILERVALTISCLGRKYNDVSCGFLLSVCRFGVGGYRETDSTRVSDHLVSGYRNPSSIVQRRLGHSVGVPGCGTETPASADGLKWGKRCDISAWDTSRQKDVLL